MIDTAPGNFRNAKASLWPQFFEPPHCLLETRKGSSRVIIGVPSKTNPPQDEPIVGCQSGKGTILEVVFTIDRQDLHAPPIVSAQESMQEAEIKGTLHDKNAI